jgi:hypothetical protein
LGIIPISEYLAPPECPWDLDSSTLDVSLTLSPADAGAAHLLITDSAGRRIGYDGARFVNEIPGAYESVLEGGLGIGVEPIYVLPAGGRYTILINGAYLSQAATGSVTQFGPGHAVSAEGIGLAPGSRDELVIAPDGTAVTFRAGSSQEITLTMALDGDVESVRFATGGLDIAPGEAISLTADLAGGTLSLTTGAIAEGSYDLELVRATADGEASGVHPGVAASASETHTIDLAAWNGVQPIPVRVEGTPTEAAAPSAVGPDPLEEKTGDNQTDKAGRPQEPAEWEEVDREEPEARVPLIAWLAAGLLLVGLVALIGGVIAYVRASRS